MCRCLTLIAQYGPRASGLSERFGHKGWPASGINKSPAGYRGLLLRQRDHRPPCHRLSVFSSTASSLNCFGRFLWTSSCWPGCNSTPSAGGQQEPPQNTTKTFGIPASCRTPGAIVRLVSSLVPVVTEWSETVVWCTSPYAKRQETVVSARRACIIEPASGQWM